LYVVFFPWKIGEEYSTVEMMVINKKSRNSFGTTHTYLNFEAGELPQAVLCVGSFCLQGIIIVNLVKILALFEPRRVMVVKRPIIDVDTDSDFDDSTLQLCLTISC
jgi:hypothetical protein